MKRRVRLSTVLLLLTAPLATALLADVKVTDQTYVRHDGGSDPVITSCGSDATTCFGSIAPSKRCMPSSGSQTDIVANVSP